jgi:uncharacterized protein (TIGR02145 family)
MKKNNFILYILVIALNSLISCGSSTSSNEVVSTSNEAVSYRNESISSTIEIKIGQQIWMPENLNIDKFRNGDHIPQAKTKEEWKKAGENKEPVWCYYNYDPYNGIKHGKLYNWYAVNDPRSIAPDGWHIPSDLEWKKLYDYLGGEYFAGKKMKNTNGWEWKDGGNGNNESGFTGVPGGYCFFDGSFTNIETYGRWWSSTEKSSNSAWGIELNCFNDNVERANYNMESGASIRCLRD